MVFEKNIGNKLDHFKMRLPESIDVNTYLAYKTTTNLESERKIKADDFDWNNNHPKSLVSLCIEKLCENWNGQ